MHPCPGSLLPGSLRPSQGSFRRPWLESRCTPECPGPPATAPATATASAACVAVRLPVSRLLSARRHRCRVPRAPDVAGTPGPPSSSRLVRGPWREQGPRTQSRLLAPSAPAGPCPRGRPSTCTRGGSAVSRAKPVRAALRPWCPTQLRRSGDRRPEGALHGGPRRPDRPPRGLGSVGLAPALGSLVSTGERPLARVAAQPRSVPGGAGARLAHTLHTACAPGPAQHAPASRPLPSEGPRGTRPGSGPRGDGSGREGPAAAPAASSSVAARAHWHLVPSLGVAGRACASARRPGAQGVHPEGGSRGGSCSRR